MHGWKNIKKIYMYICLCVYVCVDVFFNLIFTSTERPIEWTNFLTLHHQNLYAPHLYFVRTACFIQQFHFLSPAKYSEQCKSWNISSCKLHPSSVTSSLLGPYIKIYYEIILHSFYSLLILQFFRTNGFGIGYMWVTQD